MRTGTRGRLLSPRLEADRELVEADTDAQCGGHQWVGGQQARRALLLALVSAYQKPNADSDQHGCREPFAQATGQGPQGVPRQHSDQRHPNLDDHKQRREADPGSDRRTQRCRPYRESEGIDAQRQNECNDSRRLCEGDATLESLRRSREV
jgi:hypothetical protein